MACETDTEEPTPAEAAGDVSTEEAAPAPQAGSSPSPAPRAKLVRVGRVLDGDTIDLRNGKRIRLVQIDAPESGGECYGDEAGRALGRLLPAGTRIVLERDPALDDVDRYGRLLRYVRKDRVNVNLALVRRGAASVWFFDGDRGRYADRLLAAARSARRRDRGAWGACRARLDPASAFTTSPRSPLPVASHGGACMAGYDPCLPITGDLDCADVERLGRAPVRVTGSDPYRLDGDGDGVGCN